MMNEKDIEQIQEIANQAIDRAIDRAVIKFGPEIANRLSNPSSPQLSQSDSESGSRSGNSTLDEINPFTALRNRDQIDSRLARHQKMRHGSDGFIPEFYGGQVTWQNVAQGATDFGLLLQNKSQSSLPSRPSSIEGGLDGSYAISSINPLNPFSNFTSSLRGFAGSAGGQIANVASYANDNAMAINTALHYTRKARNYTNQFESLGMSLGTSPGQGFGSQVGPVRPPFINPAARTGIGATVDSYLSAAMAPGLTVKQDLGLKTTLADLGFFDGQEDTKKILGSADGDTRSGLRELMQYDPELAKLTTPSIIDAIREGGVELESLIENMKGMRLAAEDANIGLEDMNAQIMAAGEAAKAMGGSNVLGEARARAFTNATGLPPEIETALSGSSVIQGHISGMTGMPPYAQGGLGALGGELTIDALMDVISTVPEMPGIPGVPGSGAQMRAAMINQILGTNIEAKYLKKFFNEDYAHNQTEIGKVQSALGRVNKGGLNIGAARDARKAILGAKNLQGQPLFTKDEIESVKTAGGALDSVVGDIGFDDSGKAVFTKEFFDDKSGSRIWREDLVDFMEKSVDRPEGMSDEEFLSKKLTPRMKKAYIAEQQLDAAQRASESQKERKKEERNSQVTVGFTPQARKWLQEVTPGAQNNNARNAGGRPSNRNQNGSNRYGQGEGEGQ